MAPFRRSALPRSGHIKADSVAIDDRLTIAKGVTGPFRIYNTDRNTFNVDIGLANTIPVEHRCSVDVDPNGDIVVVATVAGELRGIYESINPNITIRSGKFRRRGTFTIARKLGDEAFYRIFNTDKQQSFDVAYGAEGATITVKPRMSVDVTALNKIAITAANNVSGIYDYLDPRNVIQPGRFNVTLASGAHTIIDLTGSAKRAIYRIHNSGPNPIVVERGNIQIASELLQDQSIDFEIGKDDSEEDKKVTVAPATANAPIQGMYEFLGPDTTWAVS